MKKTNFRYEWADQARGIAIFLVIYAHNFPISESYIYSFHIPFFFFIAGMFHHKHFTFQSVIKRAKSLLIPYFLWSLLLYFFWLFFGRHYGNSTNFNLDPLKGFLGVFYAQGGVQYMDWGIPMWFLPCIFLTFFFFSLVLLVGNKFIRYFLFSILIIIGFLYPIMFQFKLPWSIDVACVSLIFYGIGYFLKDYLFNLKRNKIIYAFILGFLIISLITGLYNTKIDMYRSQYGNLLLFVLSGLSGTMFVILLVKQINFHKHLTFLGRNTIPLLALHLRALTVIKFVLVLLGISTFTFSESTKLILALLQILLIIPIIFLVNKYTPILNGKSKK